MTGILGTAQVVQGFAARLLAKQTAFASEPASTSPEQNSSTTKATFVLEGAFVSHPLTTPISKSNNLTAVPSASVSPSPRRSLLSFSPSSGATHPGFSGGAGSRSPSRPRPKGFSGRAGPGSPWSAMPNGRPLLVHVPKPNQVFASFFASVHFGIESYWTHMLVVMSE